MDNKFSQASKEMIAESRNIAIDLGYDYISTLHFFLADCKRNSVDSIKDFAFNTDQELQQYYESNIQGNPTIHLDTLPLTKEAEVTIRKGIVLMKTARDKIVQPWHFFLAASQLKETVFYDMAEPKEELFERLEKYYTNKGVFNKIPEPKSFWARLFK